jgi:NTE family protein
MLKYISLHTFIILLVLALPFRVEAQKVGLVLSGGGAKGAAHIGVLKALEEEGIPIDYITGTSIGAIIGGMYASGYSPEQLEEIITSDRFTTWVKGEIEDEYFFYFKQAEPDASWITLRFQADSILTARLPHSLVSPVQLDFVLMEFFAAAAAGADYDFDSLFIPFRCIASDIANNKEVVLRKGDLSAAVRASMTFPFYFKPIRIDGKLLLDGGMYNNFPSDVMYEDFFPDMIIGSKVASNYAPPTEDNILSQVQTVFMTNTEYSVICDNGVLIEPNLGPVNIIDFSKAKEFIDSGYAATQREIAAIRSFLTISKPKSQVEQERAEYLASLPEVSIDSIIIQGLNDNQSQYIRRSLSGRDNNVLNIDELREEYFKLIADDKISGIYPRLRYSDESGRYKLNLAMRKANNIAVSFGGSISSSPTNEAFLELKYKYLGKQAITVATSSYIGRFYSSALVKTRIDYPGRIPFYIRAGFSIDQFDYFKTSTYFFEDKTPSYLIKNENNVFADLGWPITNKDRMVIRLATGFTKDNYYQNNFFTRLDTADRSSVSFNQIGLLYERSNLNRKQYASLGHFLSVGVMITPAKEDYIPGSTSRLPEAQGIEHDWFRFRMQLEHYFPLGKDYTLGVYGDLLIAKYSFLQNYTATMLSSPAFEPIPESMTRFMPSYRAHNFAGLGLKHIFHLANNFDFRLESYLFQPSQEIKNADGNQAEYGKPFSQRSTIVSSNLVFHSPIGPVSISVNHYDRH